MSERIESCVLDAAWAATIMRKCERAVVRKGSPCQVWRGAMQGSSPRFYPAKWSLDPRAVMFLLAHGKEAHIRRARYRCVFGTANCCETSHLRQVPIESEISARMLAYCADPLNRKKRSISACSAVIKGRAHQKIDPARIPEILADNRVQRLIAMDYGVTQSAISMIKNGKRWRCTNRYLQTAAIAQAPP